MLEALVITLREGVEAALIVGITLAYLNKTGRQELRKTVYAGLDSSICGEHRRGDRDIEDRASILTYLKAGSCWWPRSSWSAWCGSWRAQRNR